MLVTKTVFILFITKYPAPCCGFTGRRQLSTLWSYWINGRGSCLQPLHTFLLCSLRTEAFTWLVHMFDGESVQRLLLGFVNITKYSFCMWIIFYVHVLLTVVIFYCVLNVSNRCQWNNSYPRLWLHTGVSGVYNYTRHHYGTRLWVSRMLLNCFASSVCVYCFSSHWKDCSH